MSDARSKTGRVLVFSTAYLPLMGGAEVAIREITDRATGFEFDLVCARLRPGLSRITHHASRNVRVHRIGFGISFDKYLLPILGPLYALFVIRYSKFDLLWSMQASFGGFAALFYSWMRPKTRFLLTLQEGDPFERYAKRAGIFRGLHHAIFRRADFVQALSGFLGEWALKMGFVGKPIIIPNGVDVSRFTQHAARNTQHNDVRVISVSRLSHKNGIDLLIRAMAMLPERVKLILVGDGEDRSKLEALSLELGIATRVQFVGQKNHEEVAKLFQESDIFCRPSRTEGLGNSFLEAMAAGLPTIGTPVGGISDFLVEGETGWLCMPEDVESIAAAIRRVMEAPQEVVSRVTLHASRLIRERYNWDTIGKEMTELFERVSSGKRILIATGIYPPEIGGPATVISEFVSKLEGEGNAVRVITYGDESLKDGVRRVSRQGGVIVRYFRFTNVLRTLLRPDSTLFATDVFSVGIPSRLALLLRRMPFIVRLGGEWCWEDAVTKGRFHGTLRSFWNRKPDLRRRVMAWNYGWILRRAEEIRVTAGFLGDVVKHIVPSVESRIVITPNVPRATMIRSDELRPHHPVRFIYIGRFAPVKNVPFIARVLKRLSDEGLRFEMRFVGDGEEREEIRMILEGVPGIFFEGSRTYAEAMEFLSTSDVLLLPSLSDICPNVVIEANAMGIPCVITSEHGLGKLDGVTELDPMDEEVWFHTLRHLL